MTNSERPRDPLSHPCRASHKHGVHEAFLNYSQESITFVSNSLVFDATGAACSQPAFSSRMLVAGVVLGEKPPNLLIGGKAPRMHVGGKAPRRQERAQNMETIARTPLQLGNYIRQRRRELGLTQEKLAATVGVRQRTVSDIETSAAARFDTVLRTLAALDLELVIRPRTKGSSQDIERLF